VRPNLIDPQIRMPEPRKNQQARCQRCGNFAVGPDVIGCLCRACSGVPDRELDSVGHRDAATGDELAVEVTGDGFRTVRAFELKREGKL
jgi:hypothetical protein